MVMYLQSETSDITILCTYRGVRSALEPSRCNGTIDFTPAGTNVDGSAKVVQDATWM